MRGGAKEERNRKRSPSGMPGAPLPKKHQVPMHRDEVRQPHKTLTYINLDRRTSIFENDGNLNHIVRYKFTIRANNTTTIDDFNNNIEIFRGSNIAGFNSNVLNCVVVNRINRDVVNRINRDIINSNNKRIELTCRDNGTQCCLNNTNIHNIRIPPCPIPDIYA